MANLFWVGGTGTWDSTTNHFATSTGGTATVAAPTSSDDVFFDANSGGGTVTINTTGGATCQGLDTTGFTGSFTSTSNLFPTGNIVLGATATHTGMFFQSNPPASTTRTITFNGKTLGALDVSSPTATGTLQFADSSIVTGAVSLTKGGLDTNNLSHTWGSFNANFNNTRVLTLGSSAINITGTGGNIYLYNVSTAFTRTANTAVVTLSGSNAGLNLNMDANGTSFVFTGGGNMQILNSNQVQDLTITGTASKNDTMSLGPNGIQTVRGTLTINGNSSANRLLLFSSVPGSSRSVVAAAVSASNADFMDITASGAASWNLSAITGGSGDAGGNTGITFTTPASQTWSGTSGGNWSANAWTSRIPLPQDDVIINAAFAASQTVTFDMPRLGKNIDFSGVTGSPTFTRSSAITLYGSLTLGPVVNWSSGGSGITFAGRGSHTITNNGIGSGGASTISITAPGGTYTLQDDVPQWAQIQVLNGTFDANNRNVTAVWISIGTGVKGIRMGSGTWSLSRTSLVLDFTNNQVFTFDPGTSTIVLTDTSGTQKQFVGGNQRFSTLRFTASGGAAIQITGSNQFSSLDIQGAGRAVTLAANGTQTISGGTLTLRGTAASPLTVASITGGQPTKIVVANGAYTDLDSYSLSGDVTLVTPPIQLAPPPLISA